MLLGLQDALISILCAEPTVHFWQPETLKVYKECGQDGVAIRLARVCNLTIVFWTGVFIVYIRVTVQASNILAADVCGSDILHLHILPHNRY